MGINGTDFTSASATQAPPTSTVFDSNTHFVILDWHTPTLTSTNASTSLRLKLRDAFARFLQLLFTHSSIMPSTNHINLLCTNGTDDTHTPRLSLVVDTPALPNQRNHPPAQARLRLSARACHRVRTDHQQLYADRLVSQLQEWIAPCSDTNKYVYIFIAHSFADILSNALLQNHVLDAPTTHIMPVSMARSHDCANDLDEILARLLQTVVSATFPCPNTPSLQLRLLTRPRILPTADTLTHPPETIVATKRIRLSSLQEDAMTGVPWIVWTATPDMFAALCRAISAAKQAILCVTQRNGSMSLSVLVACGAGAGIALLREVAHADTVLPLPRGINVHAVSNADANASAPPHRTDGTLKLLPLDDYDRHTLRVGGVRVRGGTGKVAFSDIPNRAP